jgi:hypothetical protein
MWIGSCGQRGGLFAYDETEGHNSGEVDVFLVLVAKRDILDDGGGDAPVLQMHPGHSYMSLLDATSEGREQAVVGPTREGRGEARSKRGGEERKDRE